MFYQVFSNLVQVLVIVHITFCITVENPVKSVEFWLEVVVVCKEGE